ncbi:MAG: hypothetical protein QOJ62_2150 [Actinomycetota bacterium]|nr:hypothetical protein [Actinomycetota bacterium]
MHDTATGAIPAAETPGRVKRHAKTTLGFLGATLLIAGCATPGAGARHGAAPPKLHIGSGTASMAGDAAVAPLAAGGNANTGKLSTRFAMFGGYVLAGPLPDQPTHAPVWRWADTAASQDDVLKVAKAVGLAGTPQRHAYGWELKSAAGQLLVRDGVGHQWAYARADTLSCLPYSLDIDHKSGAMDGSGCAVAESSAAPPPAGPDEATARAAAAPLFAALALSGTEQVSVGMPTSSVLISPAINGMPTQGLETSVDVDAKGIRSAIGRLDAPNAGDDYPLRTAKSAFDELGNGPHTMMMPYCGPMPMPMGDASGSAQLGAPEATTKVAPAVPAAPALPAGPSSSAVGAPPASGKPAEPAPASPMNTPPGPDPIPASPMPCPTPVPVKVTGAVLGLELSFDGIGAGSEVLVPAWFFSTEGSTYPTTAIAVDPSFLADPTVPSGSADTGSGSAGSGGVAPGSAGTEIAPVPPQQTTPAPAAKP